MSIFIDQLICFNRRQHIMIQKTVWDAKPSFRNYFKSHIAVLMHTENHVLVPQVHWTSAAALLQIFGRYGSQAAGRPEEGREGDGSKRGRQAGWHWDDGGSVGERAIACPPDISRTRVTRDVEEDQRGVCRVSGLIWGEETPLGPHSVSLSLWGSLGSGFLLHLQSP